MAEGILFLCDPRNDVHDRGGAAHRRRHQPALVGQPRLGGAWAERSGSQFESQVLDRTSNFAFRTLSYRTIRMSEHYLLPCSCGQKVRVGKAQAGGR